MKPVPEREAAKAAKERFYVTGKPCRNGHMSKRYTVSGICAQCAVKNTLKSAAKRPEHPNRIVARAAGERHYSIGASCKHGHPDRRFVANGICVQCSIDRCAKWLKARPGYEAAAVRARRAKDPTRHRAAVKKWKRKNPEKAAALLAAWKATNIEHWRDYMAMYARARRSQKVKNGGAHTVGDIRELRALQKGKCAGCGRKTKLEVDHVLAVVRGGSNDRSNLQLLCRTCNASKGAKDAIEWAQERGLLI